MVSRFLFFASVFVLLHQVVANYPERCTAIIVGKKVSTDGSTMTTHTNDCVECDSRISYVPAKDFPEGAELPLYLRRAEYPRYVGYARGPGYYPLPGQNLSEPIGYIPQVRHTFAYWDGPYGLINEHQVAFGESTCAAKLITLPKTQGGEGLVDISALSRIAMERARTAREAIRIMGEIAEKHNFYGEDWRLPYSEGGEALTVIDPNETWVFHILAGPGGKGAIWAAARVADDEVAVVPNTFIIRGINPGDPNWYMASSNVFSAAKELGLWDGVSPFDFAKVYSPHPLQKFFDVSPLPRYSSLRTWRIHSQVAPSKKLSADVSSNWEFPFAVKAEIKLSARDVMNLQRDHYEGTEFDMTKGMMAGPFNNPNRAEGGKGVREVSGEVPRAISIPRTVYATVIQARNWLPNPVGGVLWFAADAPATSVFVPFYAGATEDPRSYSTGSMHKFTRNAWWAFDFVANWAELMYSYMIKDINAEQKKIEDELFQQTYALEQKLAIMYDANPEAVHKQLSAYTRDTAERVVSRWWSFAENLIVKYNDGYLNVPDIGRTLGYPAWWLKAIGFDHDVHPKWNNVTATATPLAVKNEATASRRDQPNVGLGPFFGLMFAVGFVCAMFGYVWGRRQSAAKLLPVSVMHQVNVGEAAYQPIPAY